LGLDDLLQRPERDALAVRETPAVPPKRHQPGLVVEVREQLSDDAALAHARLAEQRDELDGWLSARARERVLEELELVAPAHERGRKPPLELGSEPASGGLSDPDALRLGLALDLHWVQRLVVEYVFREPVCPLAHQDPADRRDSLQPGGGIHHVADGDALIGSLRTRPRRRTPVPRSGRQR
jgi:hypothetical protein